MKVTIAGTGYVGLVTGACLAEMGNHVVCLDVDAQKIRTLESGVLPIHEPGLLEVVQRNVAGGRLQFTTDIERAVAHGTLQFIAVGTPPDEDGSALRYLRADGPCVVRYRKLNKRWSSTRARCRWAPATRCAPRSPNNWRSAA